MSIGILVDKVNAIVEEVSSMRSAKFPNVNMHLSYCAIFSQDAKEFADLVALCDEHGKVANSTKTGPVYIMPAIDTKLGKLRVVKIRIVDPTRPELGDVDFALADYSRFKSAVLGQAGYSLITRPGFEMIEYMDPGRAARIYFSDPPVEEHDGIREAFDPQ